MGRSNRGRGEGEANAPTGQRLVSRMCRGGKDRGGMPTRVRGTAIFGKLVQAHTTNARHSISFLPRFQQRLPPFRLKGPPVGRERICKEGSHCRGRG